MRRGLAFAFVLVALAGCAPELAPTGSYYDENIAPTLGPSCARLVTGCHLADERGVAAGNLDLSSYDSLMRRADVLDAYGPYPRPLLLLKAGDQVDISVQTLDPPDPTRPDERFVRVHTDIRHAGGINIDEGSTAYARLLQWMRSGHTRTGAEAERQLDNTGACEPGPGSASGFSADDPPANAELFGRFVSEVQPLLVERCAGSGCHGAGLADYHLSCGQSEPEQRWNFWITLQQLSEEAATSELLRKPLATSNGGAFHGGGDTFRTRDDPMYATLLSFAEQVASTAPELVREAEVTEGYRFFANRVQPILVREGCMALACHSPVSVAFNLRGGSGGAFSRFARRRNYALARRFLAYEATDVRQSRIVAKNLFPPESGGQGIVHRGGSLFEDFGTPVTSGDCAIFDAETGDLNDIPSLCVMERWHAIEREEAIARGEIPAAPIVAVAWIARPPGLGEPTDVGAYRPGADLRIAVATADAAGALSLEASRSVLALCGLDPSTTDVRGTASAWDGSRLAFGVRSAASEPYRIWELEIGSDACAMVPGLFDPAAEHAGIPTHDFDPTYAPDGRLVFASTRGGTRTAASLAPNADIYVFDRVAGQTRQVTFLLNQELSPHFMEDGRLIYTLEKRERDFHMLALRRHNLDGGDYHPLYASRGTLGFESATEVTQLPDLNFAFVAAPLHQPDGAGSIAVFNRSIGPDQVDRDPGDRGYLRSLRIVGQSVMHGGTGLYRSPAALPTGRLLASCAPGASDPMASSLDFDLCEIDPDTGAIRTLVAQAGVA
ncbi:MAG: hypothetical protein K8H88_27690, partial [Sandaracinaceae bacterium]|nr:hypothetical protein [Sandaracinaceae bacterium]